MNRHCHWHSSVGRMPSRADALRAALTVGAVGRCERACHRASTRARGAAARDYALLTPRACVLRVTMPVRTARAWSRAH